MSFLILSLWKEMCRVQVFCTTDQLMLWELYIIAGVGDS